MDCRLFITLNMREEMKVKLSLVPNYIIKLCTMKAYMRVEVLIYVIKLCTLKTDITVEE